MQATSETKSKLVADNSKMVRMKALRPLYLKRDKEFIDIGQNTEFECTEDEAKNFERSIEGYYSFYGERDNHDSQKQAIVGAVRL